MPLKTAILEHLDKLTPAAQATQACNTIVKVRRASGGGQTTTTLVGTNTDVLGVRNALLRAWRAQYPGHRAAPQARFPVGAASALVIGGGATTRSAVYALHHLGLAPIFLVNRDADEVARVVEGFSDTGVELVHLRSVADVDLHLRGGEEGREGQRRPELALVVGAIPATPPATVAEHLVYEIATHVFGLPRASPASPPPPPSENVLALPHTPIFLDMAYKPRLTPLLRLAGARGWATVGGVQAMIEQGLAQQRMWAVGSVEDAIACGGPEILGEKVEGQVRALVEGMADVVVGGVEVDRALEEPGLPQNEVI
ncbi:hypothetical protein HYPSUDRAFT_37513 [Hypholoma sublateritium FD-334 SS-4]|uniref:Uncharacterized protein n=1 Tax=Hypholoma sublateritium (strain FD-334 SS-4) TaxID=945553 RepID=A0A0D2MNL8_HYPSF|nr:hypothetical protein HYPSUDRAFT_37513 [Hypholoma sublateritium FD-334 SS-4]